jgi:hypothetical protein
MNYMKMTDSNLNKIIGSNNKWYSQFYKRIWSLEENIHTDSKPQGIHFYVHTCDQTTVNCLFKGIMAFKKHFKENEGMKSYILSDMTDYAYTTT